MGPSDVCTESQSIAFPTLDEAQIREFERCTEAIPRSYRDGQTLISVGDRDFKFFIVKSGEVEIIDHSGDAPKTIVVHGKGQFTGDVSHLTGRASVISAVARGDCEVVRGLGGGAARGALNQCPALSDVILQAFIARRQLLRESPDFVGPAGDRLPLLAPTPSASATSWPRTGCCSPGWTWRPTRDVAGCSGTSA